MGAFGGRTHSFIVRVWLEPREIEGVDPEWRGMVEHVSSGKRRYVTDLGDLSAFIAIYLEDMGVGLHGP
jgi:hypothetical protein